uniref:Cytochrome c oxidase subunit 3 n=1 Tax=Dipseudopsis sp. XG-2021 TaxID=2996733 RepID=A0A9E8RT33_9NEOP|nr:cytochrome c oxidase subunit III [Dipseudopsis sp. XG-2021]
MSQSHSNHPFHLVNYSPWPLLVALCLMSLLASTLQWMHNQMNLIMIMSLISLLLCSFQWWRDMSRESTLQGLHTYKVFLNMKWGMILFIISEILFFFSFFWTFFHSSLSPNIEIGSQWPPMYISSFNPFKIPLLNTLILISSGISVTWSHHSIMNNNLSQAITSLMITILLGLYFTYFQAIEYQKASFSMADSIYGSSLFLTTGFHGIHVIIGTSFLTCCLIRLNLNHFSSNHHFGFEAAAWYWHFVDVVWLFLFIFMYWWAN